MNGIKISQPGNDVDSGDVNLLFNSAWPTLRVITAKELKVLGETLTTIPHNLGFVPMFIGWSPLNGFLNMPRQNISIDSNNLYWSHPGNGSQLDDTSIMVFDLDIEKEYLAPKINLSTSSSASAENSVGLRFTKPDKDVSSKDLRDYIIHSSTRSPMVHAVIPMSNGSYTHDLPYNPIFLVFGQSSIGGAYTLLNNFAGVTTSGSTISITGITGKASIVILKDPFYLDSNIVKVNL